MVQILDSEIQLGFGTAENTDPRRCKESVLRAIAAGYRHIDTAQWYHNEEFVGTAIADASVSRENIQIATKVHPGYLSANGVDRTFDESLDRLGMDYVDLLYVHWPIWTYKPGETLGAFQKLHQDGLIRGIGLSNFTPELVREAQEVLSVPIAALQVELHPFLPQKETRSFAYDNDIPVVGYAPLAHGEVLDHEIIVDIAANYDRSPAQIALAWSWSKEGVVPIPKATGAHIEENRDMVDFSLDPEDRKRIDEINERRRVFDIDAAPWNSSSS